MAEVVGRPVEVANDANLGALSESMWGAARGVAHLAYVKVATGVGAGLIVDGRPYLGVGGTAGELGHTVDRPDRADLPLRQPRLPGDGRRLGRRTPLARRHPRHEISLARGRGGGRCGRRGLSRAIEDAGTAVGTAVSTLCNLFNPALIVVGGDLALAGEMLLAPLRAALRRGAIRSAADDADVVLGTLGERAEVLGAVGLVLRRGSGLVPGSHRE